MGTLWPVSAGCPWLIVVPMFDPHCPTCAARVLLTTRRLIALEPTAMGHNARLRCWCGTEVEMDIARLGAPASTPTPPELGDTAAVPAAGSSPSSGVAA